MYTCKDNLTPLLYSGKIKKKKKERKKETNKEILLNSIENYVQTLMLQQKKGGEKNVIVMYTCKDNLIPLLYSGKI